MKWGPLTSPYYWYSLGLDQALHMLVYAAIIKQITLGISLKTLFTAVIIIIITSIVMSAWACVYNNNHRRK